MESPRAPRRSDSTDRLEQRLSHVERELDCVLRDATAGPSGEEDWDPVRRRRLERVLASFASRMDSRLRAVEPLGEEELVQSALELLHPDQLLRIVARLRMRHRSEEVDDFGADPKVDAELAPVVGFLYRRYFRVTAEGVANVPESGRCLLVANRSGVLPWDALMIKAALEREHAAARRARWLIEDFVYNQPFLGSLIAQLGGVRACQENAERLLGKEELVCVFPEGTLGATKLYRDRYRIGRFGRGGYVRLVLRTGTPIVPVAVIGAEEAHPVILRLGTGGKALPHLPITPTFPLLGPLGAVPVPTKWTIAFGEPIHFDGGPDGADDLVLVRRLNERVRTVVKTMVDDALRRRRSWLFG